MCRPGAWESGNQQLPVPNLAVLAEAVVEFPLDLPASRVGQHVAIGMATEAMQPPG